MRLKAHPFIILIALATVLFASFAANAARLKDVADVEGVRSNKLIGYGLVIGLNKTGDGNSVRFTRNSITNMLENMGVTVDAKDVKSGNAASVMVTAELPPFARQGSALSATVSSLGDAKSLQGGTLIMTPLKGPDGKIYAVAQGAVSLGGFSAESGGDSFTKNHPTVGLVPNGAIVEREIPFRFNDQEQITLNMRSADFSTIGYAADAINMELGGRLAVPVDSRTITVNIPEEYKGNLVAMMARIENVEIRTDMSAKVVLNERTGTVVMGQNVRISTIAISHGNLHVKIRTTPAVSQPGAFSSGQTVSTQQSSVQATEENRRLFVVESGGTIGELVQALNAVGVTPRDLISILQSIKSAGALHAKLEII
jgi:flagellar P-ring protein FlgI